MTKSGKEKLQPTLERQTLLRIGQQLRARWEFSLDDPLPPEMQLQLLRLKEQE